MNLNLSLKIPGVDVDMIEQPETYVEKRRRHMQESARQNAVIKNVIEECMTWGKNEFVPYQWADKHISKTLCSKLVRYDAYRRLHYHQCFLCDARIYEPGLDAFCLKIMDGLLDVSKVICGGCLYK